MMNSAPTSGGNVVTEDQPAHHQPAPRRTLNQVMNTATPISMAKRSVEVAGLQQRRAARHVEHARRDAVRSKPSIIHPNRPTS
jgi:hypothetical protein